MKTGTVRWFSLQKGFGFIHPDDGGPNIFVDMSAVERAGMSSLKEGQRLGFRVSSDRRTGSASAVSLVALVCESFRYDRRFSKLRPTATPPPLDNRFATKNPFDIISEMISIGVGGAIRTLKGAPPRPQGPQVVDSNAGPA
jgi:CspA family cold shock protein